MALLKAALLGAGLLATSYATATVLTTWWVNKVYLPRIAGED